ncbi:Probable Hypothetical protein polymerase III subunit RPC6 [Nesidiocoris tenuis]|uniref:DNA-directed RNA polymerase subunit n=1 Tax=Nesidiocoris tenuis TaxID=355587 RepID=A0ABN7AD07_9HEMI|nr:Probable Hypothetical protein polymerase III subunit RPC6 [Nesidiocoris tenuis]
MNTVAESGFCPECGTILPYIGATNTVKCFSCKKECGLEAYAEDNETVYTVVFNTYTKKKANADEPAEEGPIVERTCKKCGHDRMSYATLQLRSADEGQTVFYTCSMCKFKETENS